MSDTKKGHRLAPLNPKNQAIEKRMTTIEMRGRARHYAHKAIQRLAELLDDEDPRIQLTAAKEILDRGYGKAPQAIEVSEPSNDPFREMQQEDLMEITSLLQKINTVIDNTPEMKEKLLQEVQKDASTLLIEAPATEVKDITPEDKPPRPRRAMIKRAKRN